MNPLPDNTGDKQQFPLPKFKDQKPQKDEKTVNLSQEVFGMMMQEFKDTEGDESGDLLPFKDKIVNNILPIPSDSLFADTDMIVYKDDFRGYISPNGIKESDLKKIENMYQKIANGDSQINIKKNDEAFRNEVLLCIKTLMTREIGRKIITELMHSDMTYIKPGPISKADYNEIFINTKPTGSVIRLHPSGKLTHAPNPLFITLGHEMIHMVHYHKTGIPYGQEPPTLDFEGVQYDNLEEQVAITGFKKGLSIKEGTEVTDNEDWSSISHDYDELNERSLTAAFTGSLTEFFNKDEEMRLPRIGHKSISPDFSKMIKGLIQANVLYDLEKLIEEKSLTKETINKLFKPGELHLFAIEHGQVEALKLLMKIDPNPLTSRDESLLHIIAKNPKNLTSPQFYLILDALLETRMDVNQVNLEGFTAFHYFALVGDEKALQKLVKNGANIHLRNMYEQDPFDCALDGPLRNIGVKTSPELKTQLHSLYQLIKKVYPTNELIQKFIEPEFAKNFLSYGDEESILDYLDILHHSGHDLTKLDESGNSILHYGGLSCMPIVLNKLKEQYKCDMHIKNQNGQTVSDYLINQLPYFFRLKKGPWNQIEGESVFDSVYHTLNALEVNLDQYKESILRDCDKIHGPTFEPYVRKLMFNKLQ